jgi:hypothetical protein
MSTIVSYTASMITRKTTSASNFKNSAASQEYYEDTYNLVGVLHFAGMSLVGKVITGIQLSVTPAGAGLGAGHTKTVYLRKSNYQGIVSGVTGNGYVSDALGTYTGSFYNNSTTTVFSGALLNNLIAYFEQGYNTLCIYNPSPVDSGMGTYSRNYLQWGAAVLTVSYDEAASVPTTSVSSVNLGGSVTISTNRLSASATHTLSYSFGNAVGTIATGVGDSYAWTPPLSLAQQIPSAVSGMCTITCQTYYGGSLTGTRQTSVQLNVPASVVPTISGIAIAEAITGITAQFSAYVQEQSRLAIDITAVGAQGSTISSYRTLVSGSIYNTASFTTNAITESGTVTITSTVVDTRGRSASVSRQIAVEPYARPLLSAFRAERCDSTGANAKPDGDKVRINVSASVSSVNGHNTMRCQIYYKRSTETAWSVAEEPSVSGNTVSFENRLLPQTYNTLYSYDIFLIISDWFTAASQIVSVGTKQVVMDFFRGGNGIAFGKVAETNGAVEFGWPIVLDEPLGIAQGGTGASTAAAACSALGALARSGGTMTGNLSIQGSLYPSLYLLPTYNGTTNRTVFEGSYAGASSFAAWEDSTGNNRRMLEVRTATYAPSMDNALLLRTAVAGTYYQYRVFHTGMATPVPIANGGTGGGSAKAARCSRTGKT